MSKSIENFFYPKSICIAGASSKEKSIGYELLRSIKNYGFTGKILPVNPKAESILGYKCFKSINDIKGQIDLAKECIDKFFISDDAYGYAYSIRAYIQQFRGTPDDVRNDFLKAIELGDENASAMLEEYEQLLFKKEKN